MLSFREFSYLKKTWSLRYLAINLIRREFYVKYKQSILGWLWAIIKPVSLTLVLYFSFYTIGKQSAQNPFLSILSGLLVFDLFINIINNCSKSIISNRPLIEKQNIPRLIFPISIGLTSLVDYVIGLFLFIIIAAYTQFSLLVSIERLGIFIIIFFSTILMAMSIGFLLSAACVWARDVKFLVTYISQLLLLISPIGFSEVDVPNKYSAIMSINPLNQLINMSRSVMINTDLDATILADSARLLTLSIAMFLLSASIFTRLERSFADVL